MENHFKGNRGRYEEASSGGIIQLRHDSGCGGGGHERRWGRWSEVKEVDPRKEIHGQSIMTKWMRSEGYQQEEDDMDNS